VYKVEGWGSDVGVAMAEVGNPCHQIDL